MKNNFERVMYLYVLPFWLIVFLLIIFIIGLIKTFITEPNVSNSCNLKCTCIEKNEKNSKCIDIINKITKDLEMK